MEKTVSKSTQLQFTPDFPGLKGVNIMASQYPIEPVLVFTEFLMEKPVFGPHPHAGISVMTYMLPDSKQGFINRDSLGDFSHIEPGGYHISQAGKGLFHDEFPKQRGIEAHGFQIWFNHSASNREVTPKSMHASPDKVAEFISDDYKVRIVQGAFGEKQSAHQMVTEVNLFHVFLQPQRTIELQAKEMAFVYGLNGEGAVGQTKLRGQTLINFTTSGNKVIVKSNDERVEFMYASAQPINEPIVYGGPFVMTTDEQMRATRLRLASGEMGSLSPFPNA